MAQTGAFDHLFVFCTLITFHGHLTLQLPPCVHEASCSTLQRQMRVLFMAKPQVAAWNHACELVALCVWTNVKKRPQR
eukprot:2136481-Pleurochrysis_carterae.AAC.2